MGPNVAFYRNDNFLELVGAHDAASGQHFDDDANPATVQAIVRTKAATPGGGDEVAGQAWPVTLAYVPGSQGDFRAVLSESAELELGKTYEAEISLDAGQGRRGRWFLLFTVQARRA